MYRFGPFQVDPRAHELRRSGIRVKIQEQPFVVLLKLLEHPGELVTREELRLAIWPADTFVDFDTGLNTVVMRLREALGDSAEAPTLIETAPRLGYRFIAPVESFDSERAGKPRKRPTYYVPVVLGAVVLTVGLLAISKTVLRASRQPRVLRFTRLTNDGQAKRGPMATDGSRIYFNEVLPASRTLIVQVSINGGEAIPLSVPLKHPEVLDLSKDGTELLVEDTEELGLTSLWLQPVAGGSPRRVGTVRHYDARFGADGTSIVYGNGHDIYSVNQDGSSTRKLLTVDSTPFAFRFSPDATIFRFSKSDDQIHSSTIMETAADGTGLHNIFRGCCGEWTSDGRFFIFESQSGLRLDLWALPEGERFRLRKRDDKPIQLTAGPLNFRRPLPSKDGKTIFAVGDSHRAEVIRYDSGSSQFVPYLSGISAEGLAFSRDGQWVTYTSFPEGTLWRSKVDGSERRQLTVSPLRVLLPRWSPDGQQIAFFAAPPGKDWNIYLVSIEGGTPERILPSEQSQADPNWSPEGNSLVFGTFAVPQAPIYTIDLRSKRVSTLPGSNGLFSPRWSPDGRYIAALTTERPFKLMLFDFSTQKWTEAFGSEVGYLWWSREGKYIYLQDKGISAQGFYNRIVRLRLSDRKLENIVDVKNVGRLTTGTIVDWFGLAPDDSLLFARDISTAEIYALEMDWP
jgi:Tol biopolymer transport system component/DNA-binding winged helix-turn-helix (wHTH) protein